MGVCGGDTSGLKDSCQRKFDLGVQADHDPRGCCETEAGVVKGLRVPMKVLLMLSPPPIFKAGWSVTASDLYRAASRYMV